MLKSQSKWLVLAFKEASLIWLLQTTGVTETFINHPSFTDKKMGLAKYLAEIWAKPKENMGLVLENKAYSMENRACNRKGRFPSKY